MSSKTGEALALVAGIQDYESTPETMGFSQPCAFVTLPTDLHALVLEVGLIPTAHHRTDITFPR